MEPSPPSGSKLAPEHHPRVRWSRWKAHSHVAVWIAAILAALAFFLYGAHTGGVQGYVEIVEHPIASVELARLQSIDASVGDHVAAGQVLAHMDASALDAEIAAAQALCAEMEATVPAPEQVALQWERQFTASVADAAAALDAQLQQQAQDQAELDVITEDLKRLQPLLENNLVDATIVNTLRARHAVLNRAVTMHPKNVTDRQARLMEAQRHYSSAASALNDTARYPDGTNHQAVAQAMTLASLQARRREYVLRSPSEGIVSQVMFRPGDVVAAGLPALVVIEQPSRRVIGFLPELNARDAHIGQNVQIARMYGYGTSYRATLSAMEPAVRGLPGQVNPVPGRIMRGRRIYCNLSEETDLLPGETVQLRFRTSFLELFQSFLGGILSLR